MRPRFLALLEPWLGSLTPLLVPGYVFMLVLGAILGSMIIVDRTKRVGFAPRDTLGVLMATYACGLAGACAVPVVQGFAAWIEGGRFAAPTGIAAYGGLVGGTVGTLLALRGFARKPRFDAAAIRRFFDAGAPAVALGVFFARIGCFLAGCDYGAPTSSSSFLGRAAGTRFPAGSHAFQDHVASGLISPDAISSLPVHPTQLYEALAGLLLWGLTMTVPERARFMSVVVGYAISRSIIETFRGDAARGHVGVLSTAQLFAIVTTAIAVYVWIRQQNKNENREHVVST